MFLTPYIEGFHYREAFMGLLAQDFKLKYRRTILGYFWSLLNPLIYVGVMSVVFSNVLKVRIENYPLYLFSGWAVWALLQGSLMASTNAFTENEGFIKKIYVPKILFPLSRVGMKLVEFFLTLFSLLVVAACLQYPIRSTWLLLPTLSLFAIVFVSSLSILVAYLYVFFRDLQYILSFGLQLAYFSTPILYPKSALSIPLQQLQSLNPFYALVLPFQKAIYFGEVPSIVEIGALGLWTLGFGLLVTWVMVKFDSEIMFRL